MTNKVRKVKQCNTNGVIEFNTREEIVSISDSNLDSSIKEKKVIISDWLEKVETDNEEYRTTPGKNFIKKKNFSIINSLICRILFIVIENHKIILSYN